MAWKRTATFRVGGSRVLLSCVRAVRASVGRVGEARRREVDMERGRSGSGSGSGSGVVVDDEVEVAIGG